ncbi:hypothetical protein FRC12_019407 [Ceratobasidium sp. 428]|nr:hypothetical protein FRC12_019407 [Ceratobasidium sp. 428]
MNTTALQRSASSRVFEVSELLHLVCSFASVPDRARVSRTCKAGLRASIGLVWRTTYGRPLLSLLGATRTSINPNNNAGNRIDVMSISWSERANFSRFDFYAPYVRRFEVYGPGLACRYFRVEGWEHLTLRARQRPLLPKLSSIHLHSFMKHHRDDVAAWITAFISPSLTEVQVGSTYNNRYATHLPLLTAEVILDTVAASCPQLQQLTLFSSQTPTLTVGPSDKLLGFFWRRPYHESLSKLNNLVELTCAASIFEDDSILVVSSLPVLRRLTIVGSTSSEIPNFDDFRVDSFPALLELHLAGSEEYDLAATLTIPPLMSHLTHLELDYWPEDQDLDLNAIDSLIDYGAFRQLKNSPHLLFFALVVDSEERAKPYDIGDVNPVETFSGLPLETIILIGVEADAWMYDVNRLKTAWVNVTSVSMPDQLGLPSVLKCFAQLPALLDLKIKLSLATAWDYPEEPSTCPLHTLESSSGGMIQIEPEDLKGVGE